MIRSTTLGAALSLAIAAPAAALPPLDQNRTVVDGFYAIGLADEVRKNCDDIAPRMFRAFGYLRQLHAYAKDAGYSDDQIDALTKDKAAKAQLKARIRSDLAARGASADRPQGYCAVGREEIAADSAAGRLLKAR